MTDSQLPARVSSVRQMPLGPMQNYVYLIGCERTKEAAVVDPGWDAPAIVAAADRAGFRITKIFATHHHFDHVNGAAALAEATGAQKYANAHEVPLMGGRGAGGAGDDWLAVEDNQVVKVGEAAVTCLHTPGHTVGSQCLLIEGRVLTGDTLFVGNIGRCDLPGSSPQDLYHSLMRLKALPPETIVLPGHNYAERPSSTIGEEAQRNVYMRIPSAEAFLHLMGQ